MILKKLFPRAFVPFFPVLLVEDKAKSAPDEKTTEAIHKKELVVSNDPPRTDIQDDSSDDTARDDTKKVER